jgi:hypothetical protein
MPHKSKNICTHVGRQVARINVNDLRSAEPLELVGLAVVCHNLAVMTVKELNRRLPEDDRVDLAGMLPSLRAVHVRGRKGKLSEPVH